MQITSVFRCACAFELIRTSDHSPMHLSPLSDYDSALIDVMLFVPVSTTCLPSFFFFVSSRKMSFVGPAANIP